MLLTADAAGISLMQGFSYSPPKKISCYSLHLSPGSRGTDTLQAEPFLTVHMLCTEKRLCTNRVKFLLSMRRVLLRYGLEPRPNPRVKQFAPPRGYLLNFTKCSTTYICKRKVPLSVVCEFGYDGSPGDKCKE